MVQSADIIYDFYGLAFFVLGVAVAARSVPLPNSVVKFRIVALAVFGLLHGIYEWLHLSEFSAWTWNTPVFRQGLSVTSFMFLLYFALGGRGRVSAAVAVLGVVALAAWGTVAALATNPVTVEVATRWGFAVPVAILAGITFLRDSSLRGQSRKQEQLSQLSAAIMFFYAGLQLFVSPAEFFPANVLSTQSVMEFTGVSVLVMRGVCALVLTGGVLLLLNSFDEAIRNAAYSAAERAEEELRLNKLMLAAVFEAAPVGLVLTDIKSGRIVEANKAIWTMIGYTQEDMDGQRMKAITPDEFRESDDEALELVKRDGRLEAYEKEYTHKDGHRVAVRVEAVRLPSERGEDLLLSVIQDVSEQKDAEQRIRRQQALAEKANIAKSQFMANMSH